MSCAACQARIESAVRHIPGVTECSVSLLTNTMGVEGSASTDQIISAVQAAGYGATLSNNDELSNLYKTQTPTLAARLATSAVFLLALLYLSMAHTMWNWPLPAFLTNNPLTTALTQMLLSVIILLINRSFFTSGFKSLLNKAPNMDSLVSLGAGVSFLYSVIITCKIGITGQTQNLYFESTGTILTLITLGKLLESVSKGKTTNALKNLINLTPKTANVIIEGIESTVSIDQVKVGDFFVVRPGESIPTDALIIDGNSAVNEAALTGESVPVDKNAGDNVFAATLNTNGFLTCKATKVGKDTTLSQIIQLVSDAAATKAPIAKIADKVSGIFVPAVIGISIVTTVIWLICGSGFATALTHGIAVLVVSCPCALGLATPVAIMVGNGVGAKNGILFKTSAALELAGKSKIVALDKTGTITKGQMEVVDIKSDQPQALIDLAFSIEQKSEHPIAKAIVKAFEQKVNKTFEFSDFKAIGGLGVTGTAENFTVFGGNLKFIQQTCPTLMKSAKLRRTVSEISNRGQTPLIFATRGDVSLQTDASTHAVSDHSPTLSENLLGIIAVADVIKENAEQSIRELKALGLEVVMISGDNEITARTIAKTVGIEEVYAGVLPDGKEQIVRSLQKRGQVLMVGDGINDAPALTRADIGVAIGKGSKTGGGSDIAVDAADIVLVNNRLEDIPAAIRLSRRTLRNIRENLFWAFFYNVILIPVAAGAWYKLFGLQLSPMIGAAAMSLSSFCVVSNALRLNFVRLYK